MLINELLNKDLDTVTEEEPLIILDIKYVVCMDNNGKDTKHTRHIYRRVHFVRYGEKCKLHNVYWCEGGQQLSEISIKNVAENNLNPRMKYIMTSIGK